MDYATPSGLETSSVAPGQSGAGRLPEGPGGGAGKPAATAASFLVTTAKLPSPSGSGSWLDRLDPRRRRFFLQAAARELLIHLRIAHCLRTPFSSVVWLRRHRPTSKASYDGLQTCGLIWVCPVCAAKISERRRVQLGAAIGAWEALGGRVCLATFTVRHGKGDGLPELLAGLGVAFDRTKSGKAWQEVKTRHGIAGSIRALEVTHGRHGFHPHLHVLLFTAADVDGGRLDADLRHLWDLGIRRAGLKDVNEHGVSVGLAQMTIAEYVAKFGRDRAPDTWGPKEELVRANRKRGRAGNRTPWDLLAAYACEHDGQAGSLFRGYAEAMKGKHQLTWSTGLRAMVLPDEKEQTDEELAAAPGEDTSVLAGLTLAQWRVVLANDSRAELLDTLEAGGLDAVRELLGGFGADPQLVRAPAGET